ncbi:hypothetical protein [Alloalcanivorax gelatiniphagus]|uniref:Uncharacterized protein n=1 Tax=Alloalcanivorax gelatiniphagus TaxID=1194167 RepID=A0ABY2XN64_9GAMM|nr:hypothetical protein [Alloalcanivorax gelatiniphagus]TMW12904.1 hypothetical protein FGS76_09015 [Alloalcanivorax gelatiniphagus]
MKTKLLLSAVLGVAAWSLSSMAAADWDTGPCPGGSSAPCIEAVVNGTTYHFNGTGDHAGEWHGLPTTGADFEFVGDSVELGCSGINLDCTLTLGGKVQKCQDSNGDWRIGVQVNSSNVSGGFLCSTVVLGGFPWYSRDASLANHCPFEDDCDSFIPYDPSATTYSGNFGAIDISVLGSSRVSGGHVHGVTFTPGTGATFSFASQFYDCDDDEQGCEVTGDLVLDNATSLDIQ